MLAQVISCHLQEQNLSAKGNTRETLITAGLLQYDENTLEGLVKRKERDIQKRA